MPKDTAAGEDPAPAVKRHPRVAQLAREGRTIVRETRDPFVRRARLLAAKLRYVADALESGEAGRQAMAVRFQEQVDDAWTAFHSTPRRRKILRPTDELQNLVRMAVAVAIEAGGQAMTDGQTEGLSAEAALDFGVGRAWTMIDLAYPEFAARIDDDQLKPAVKVWGRGDGRPPAGAPRGSRWDLIAQLCQQIGLTALSADDLRKAWRNRTP